MSSLPSDQSDTSHLSDLVGDDLSLAPSAHELLAENDQDVATNDAMITQLKRIRGQLDGLIEMYQKERPCIDIVRQMLAARNSLGRVARDMLTCEAGKCSRERRIEDLDEIFKELFRY